MNKLLSVLLAAALVTPAFAADAPKPAAEAKTEVKAEANADAKPAAVKSSEVGQPVTPQSDAAYMKEVIAKAKADSDAAKAKAAESKK